MPNLSAIVRATRASAAAVAAMARHSREIDHATKTIAWNNRMVARGYMSPESAARDNAICESDLARATRCLAMARGRYDRASLILANNPL